MARRHDFQHGVPPMTQPWQPPDQPSAPRGTYPQQPPVPHGTHAPQGPGSHGTHARQHGPSHGPAHGPGEPQMPPPVVPPTPVIGIVALVLGLIGAAATLLPVLRVPGVVVGLVAAVLAVVAVASKGLGGKMLAAGGFAAGLAALPLALALHVVSTVQDREAREYADCVAMFPDQVHECQGAD
ncbi:hypothetical protein E1292_36430 [Nonomuraea deserti]|uniref:DUF4190 domain-containing protein n=1 Tax=Nonomuraea deserti TaxID=1848322 RepID=A0A4R4V608_9ACTN|nr:hypothetical protein [Nonomuraea deserti]TDC97782.1 hypothetical protein E1292_36430 [Nonomuraea deserti]